MARLAFILIVSLLGGCSQERPQPQTSTRPAAEPAATTMPSPPRFDGQAAFALLLKQTSFGPRNPNSAGHKACLDFLAKTLGTLADRVELQRFTHQGYGEVLELTNVFARFKPEASSRILLLTHWDTRPRAERDENKQRRDQPILGANDGASGTAILLHLASLLKQAPPAIGVDLLCVDGEDYGKEGDNALYLLGSRYFVSSGKPAGYAPRFGILLDMVGDTYLEIPREQNSVRDAPDIVDLVWNTAHNLGIHQFIDDPGEYVIDDHLPLNEAGIKTIDIIDFDYPDPTNRYWHTTQDTPEHCSAESLEAVGTVVTTVLYTQQP